MEQIPPGAENDPHELTIPAGSELSLLAQGCARLGIALTAEQLAQFARYAAELRAWNERLNLTAITGHDEVQVKHFLDSLVSLPLLAEELGQALTSAPAVRLVDVGTGAGFPGLPLKLAMPALDLTLVDGTQKKIAFLQTLVTQLGVDDVQVVHGRAEELGRQPAHRAQYDIVTARAVAALDTLVEYLVPLARVGGLIVVYKGPGAPQEFMDARQAIKVLGADAVRLAPVEVPFLAERRFVLLLKKVRPTPNLYPRGQGLARKRPLA